MIKQEAGIENAIVSIQSNAGLNKMNSIPIEILRLFVYSLFEDGAIQIGKHRIVSWNNNDRHIKNKMWNSENKKQFEEYGLLTEIKMRNGEIFHEISCEAGAQVWRLISKEINKKQPGKTEVKKIDIIRRYPNVSLSELIKRRDALETERKQMMADVARASAKNRGHHTSVKVKEGYAERLISIIDNIETEIEYRAVS